MPGRRAQAASTALLAALGHDVVPGGYYTDCRPDPAGVHARAHDTGLAHRLWEISEAAVRPLAEAMSTVAVAVADATDATVGLAAPHETVPRSPHRAHHHRPAVAAGGGGNAGH